MGKKNKFKNRIGIVYSTEDSYDYEYNQEEEEDTLPKNQQQLIISLDKKGRKGKQVTLVSGFTGLTRDIDDLSKMLKTKCGVGGNVKDREILIQGDLRQKVSKLLKSEGYGVKIR